MEHNIVKDFQNLHMFSSYNIKRMDELVQDLTNALEESTKSKSVNDASLPSTSYLRRHYRKHKGKRRRANINGLPLFEVVHFSEASESSVDEALKDYLDTITRHSDSDELIARRLAHLTMPLSKSAIAVIESDSVTENFSPIRAQRRRRKFKTMAVDPSSDTSLSTASDLRKSKRYNSLKTYMSKPKLRSLPVRTLHEQTNSDNMIMPDDPICSRMVPEEFTKDFDPVIPGKRKRNAKSRSEFVCVTVDAGAMGGTEHSASDIMETNRYSQESSSPLSSSDSEGGIVTNDEAREADDEQSDFYYDTDAACGIPGIIPWWENDDKDGNEMDTDSTFQQILTGSFSHLSPASQLKIEERMNKILRNEGRKIRSGRRKLKEKRPRYTMSRFLQDRQTWKIIQNKHTAPLSWQPTCTNSNGQTMGDWKRRRNTPPPSPVSEGYVGDLADEIPESNIGNQLLQSLGWIPGHGLGVDGAGITTPVIAYRRPRWQGLGYNNSNSSDT